MVAVIYTSSLVSFIVMRGVSSQVSKVEKK
jgi:hypothetical protein